MSATWLVLKEKGNEEYKKKEYSSAITFYTDGISNIKIIIKNQIQIRMSYTLIGLYVTLH